MIKLNMWMSPHISWSFHCITFNRQKTHTNILLNVLTLKSLKMVNGFCRLRLGLMNTLMNLSVPQKVGNFLTSRVTTGISKRILLHGIYTVPFILNYISRTYIYHTTCLWNSYLKTILFIGTSICTCTLLLYQHASPWLLQTTCHKIT